MRDFIENVTGLKSYNVSHDPLLYTLSEFPQGDDAGNMSEVRSYGFGNGTGFEHNTSAIAATLYMHENLLGANGTNGTGVETPFGLLDLASDHNLTDIMIIENITESENATTMTSPLGDAAEPKFREVDLSEVTTVSGAIEVTTMRVPEDARVATFSRLVDRRDMMDNETGSGDKTGRAEVESGEDSFVTTNIAGDNATLPFHEQNDVEATTLSSGLVLTTEEFTRNTTTAQRYQQTTTTTTRSTSTETSAENSTQAPTEAYKEASTFSTTLATKGLSTTTIPPQAGGIQQNSSNVEATTALVEVTTMSAPVTTEKTTVNDVDIATTIASMMPMERTDSPSMIIVFKGA